jgi:uncharacterized glyoxalase superfamily protein PhnB
MTHPTVFPTLSYDNAPAAIDFLVDAFGAERHTVYSGDDGSIAHAELRLGDGIVMLGSSRPDWPAKRHAGVYVAVDDPDALCARARAAGAEIIREPQDTDYGSREFGARDPGGIGWYFGTYEPFATEPQHEAATTGA